MSTRQIEPMLDSATVERLSDGLRRFIETAVADDDVLDPDVFVDLYPPFWRFQLQGSEAVAAQLRSMVEQRSDVRVLRTVATGSGFVTEHEESTRGQEGVETARHLWLCEVRDGRITEAVSYCNGAWDDELRARHAVEAPMLRP